MTLVKAPKGADLSHISEDLWPLAVRIDSFKLYSKNPRQGDVETVARSLKNNGQQSPIILYKFPGDKMYTVIAGNHRTKAALTLDWKYIAINRYKGTPAQAKAFAEMDNRSSDLATYDDELLAEALKEIKDLGADLEEATGYSDEDLAYLMSQVSLKDEEEDDTPGVENPGEYEEYAKQFGTLDKVVDYANDLEAVFKSSNKLEIPDLLPQLLADPPDRPIMTWPGAKYADKKWEDYWWLVWSWSTSGAPMKKSYLSFYSADESLWTLMRKPGKYTKNFVSQGLKAICTPDFSLWGSRPYPERIHSLYMNRWMGRYFQEVGLNVIPNINVGIHKNDLPYHCMGIPKRTPCVSIQVQTGIDRHSKKEFTFWYKRGILSMLKKLDPQSLIIYGSKLGHELTKNLLPTSLHTIRLATVQDTRRGHYKPDPLSGKVKSYKKKRVKLKTS